MYLADHVGSAKLICNFRVSLSLQQTGHDVSTVKDAPDDYNAYFYLHPLLLCGVFCAALL
jgi:hypothetical protein